jgi:glycosyltransferase involved in cell wall biosynthesis
MFPPATGGGETYAKELARSLAEKGHIVDVYTLSIPGENNEVDIHKNVEVIRVGTARRWMGPVETVYYGLRCRSTIDFYEYDAVHGTLMPPSTISLLGCNGLDQVPLVLTSHGTSFDEVVSNDPVCIEDYILKYIFHPTDMIMDFIAGRQADKIVAISDHSYEVLTDIYQFNEERVTRILHGVEVERFNPKNPTHPDIDPDVKTLLYVGRLGPRKGLDLLLEAVSATEVGNFELIIAGSGRHEAHLRNRCSKLGIADRVRFLGYVPDDDLPSLYASADIFVLPSTYEGFGLVLLEAMSSGTPVIATKVGGIPSVVENDKTGFLIPRDSDALKQKIEYMLRNDNIRQDMAKRARSYAESTLQRHQSK